MTELAESHVDPRTLVPTPGGRAALIAAGATEKVARHLSELKNEEAYNWALVFPKIKGFGAVGDVKQRVRMLKSIEPRFSYLLFPGERIEFVTKGMLNSFLEQYFFGIWAYSINRTLFLFTNYRVVLASSDHKGRAKTLMWQIPYDKLQKYGAGAMGGSVSFGLIDGKKYKFAGVPGADRKRLKLFVRKRLEETRADSFTFPSHAGRDPLCSSCGTPALQECRACEECGEAFINPRVPALMSMFLPGLGDLYLGHRALAVFELLGFGVLVLILVSMIARDGVSAIPAAMVAIAVANGLDAAATYHVAKKGLLPQRMAWKGH